MGSAQGPSVAIVGSGPSGCYTAQFLRKRFPDSEITIFDRLPMPYGLVRFGVAPDHLGTRAVTGQFDRLFERDGVKFIANTEIGKDVSLAELRSKFQVVVLATGLSADRLLGIAGEDLSGVHGSGRLTRLINGHPEETTNGIDLAERIVIVGQGNVAIDLIRLSLMSPAELSSHGVDEVTASVIATGHLKSIDVVGRSGLSAAKFDVAMVKELVKIEDVRFTSDHTGMEQTGTALEPEAQKRVEAVQSLIDGSPKFANRTVNFHFGWTPTEISGVEKVNGVSFSKTLKTGNQNLQGGDQMKLPADSVYTAIGFTESEMASIQRDSHLSARSDLSRGYLDEGLYCVGWLRRGPTGTIPANRADAKMVADAIIHDFEHAN
jgi:ferredoxin--NADP+ reductase